MNNTQQPNYNYDSDHKSKKIIALVILGLSVLAGTWFFAFNSGQSSGIDLGHKKGYDSGFEKAKEEGDLKGFKQSFTNTAEMFKKSNLNKTIELEPLEIELDHRGLVTKLTRAAYGETTNSTEMFSAILSTVHTKVLSQLGEELKLNKKDMNSLQLMYDSIHPVISKNYHTSFSQALETLGPVDPIFERKAYTAATQFNATISESFCSLIDVLATLVVMKKPGNAKVLNTGLELVFAMSCSDLLNSIFPQMSMNLREAGAYVDMKNTEISLDGYLRKSIAEIATVEEKINDIKVKKHLEKRILENYKIRKLIGKHLDSHATVELNATAIVKAGVDIDDYFNYKVFPAAALIEITVTQPKILSREIFPSYSKLENGYLISVDKDLLNEAKDDILLRVDEVVSNGNILKKAEHNFEQFFEAIILPTLKFNGIRNVRFKYVELGSVVKRGKSNRVLD